MPIVNGIDLALGYPTRHSAMVVLTSQISICLSNVDMNEHTLVGFIKTNGCLDVCKIVKCKSCLIVYNRSTLLYRVLTFSLFHSIHAIFSSLRHSGWQANGKYISTGACVSQDTPLMPYAIPLDEHMAEASHRRAIQGESERRDPDFSLSVSRHTYIPYDVVPSSQDGCSEF